MVEVERRLRCTSCDTPLSREGSSEGLCPSCLLGLALDDTSAEAEVLFEPDEAPTLQYSGGSFEEGQIQGERYRVRSLLGRGGMGEVWRAYDLKLRQDVALKALRTDLLADPDALETLRQEVRTAREVISPNVCRVFDLQELDGQELVAMEYVDGTTLQEILRDEGPLELDRAREIASQFLAGLEAIHAAGLVHRDIKPENVMVTRTGRVVVMDFGIAKALGDGKGGLIAGTPAYMALEQAKGEALDARADVFSTGVVLAEMVEPGGVRTLEERQRLWEWLHQEPPQVAETPWTQVIGKCIAGDPDARYATAAELARALEEVTLRAVGDETARPYPGLAAFQAEDAPFFFGRELEVEAVWKKLRRPHLLAVIGPSGAGKSSFLRAGLLPTLTDGWQAIVITPGNRPFSHLARELASELGHAPGVTDLLQRIEEPEVALDLLSEWRKRSQHALLVVDQFEELFTQNAETVQTVFAELLGRLPLEADLFVLLSMRDDFVMHCHRFEALQPIFSELTPLDPPLGSALRRALVEPALRCGYRFEEESIVEEMLAEVEGERGALPMVAFTAARLWERRDRDSGLLTRRSYEQIGGVGGALAQHAESTLQHIGEERIPIVRELFRNLVTAQGTRADRDRDELLSVFEATGAPVSAAGCLKHDAEEGSLAASGGYRKVERRSSGERGAWSGEATEPEGPTPTSRQGEAAQEVLDALIDARLLTSYEVQNEGETAHHRIEVVHESLLNAWPRLVRWQRQEADSAQMRDELRAQAQLWDQHGRSADYLWTGTAFREYQLWRERYPGGLTALEEDYARAMTAYAERRRRRRRLAVGAVITALLVVLAVVTWSRFEAKAEARRAEAAKLLAIAQLRQEEDPTEALAFTIASLELTDTEEARVFALRLLWEAPPALVLESNGEWGLVASSFSPDGRHLAASGVSDTVRVWAVEGGPPVDLDTNQRSLEGLGYPRWPTNELLVTGLSGGTAQNVLIWELPSGRLVREIDFGASAWWQVGDNRLLAEVIETEADTGHELYHLREWMLPLGEARELGSVDRTALGSSQSRFDPDGSGWVYIKGNRVFYRPLPLLEGVSDRLVGTHPNEADNGGLPAQPNRLWTRDRSTSELRFWDLEDMGTEPLRVVSPPTTVEPGSFLTPGPEGRWATDLFSLGGHIKHLSSNTAPKQEARVWDLSAWLEARPLALRRSGSWILAGSSFHPTGDWLVVATRSPRLTFWPLTRTYPKVVDGYSNSFFRPVEFSPDSLWLATAWPDNSLRLWPLPGSGSREVKILPLPPESSDSRWRDLVFDPQGRFLVASDYSEPPLVVPLDGSPPRRLGFSSDEFLPSYAAVAPSGRLVATAFRNSTSTVPRTLRVWDLLTGEMRQFDLPEDTSLNPQSRGGVWNLVFTDESTLYTSGNGGVRRWDLRTGADELVLGTKPGSDRTWAAFAPDAPMAFLLEPLFGDEYLGLARILDLEGGEVQAFSAFEETDLRRPDLFPRNALDASATIVAVGDNEGIVRVARLPGGEPHLLVGHKGPVDFVAISPDGRWVASTGEDNTLRLWPMPDLDQPPLHTLSHEELIAKLMSLTNLRAIPDPDSSTGWSIEIGPFPGWKEIPTW